MNLAAPQVLPRVGWEVPVIYENGDPDRPFVLGRIHNGGAPPPYGLPGKKATATLQSATSPSDGTTQEIRMGDDSGSEEVFVHATRDQTVTVGGAHSVKVTGKRSDDVQKSQSLGVDVAQTTTVSGNQKVTVGANGTIGVKGARTETVGGNESVGVTGTYGVTVEGAYTELVGGFYSLRCNQANTTVQGAFTQVIGAALSITAGLGSNQSVAGARMESVGGARSFVAAAAYADGTTGSKRITAGAANESANADMAFNAGARAQLQAGAAMSIEGGGNVVFEAATISVKAATLTAKGGSSMKLAGALKSSSKVKLDAPVVKKTKNVKVQG
jgi:type VI secretion system secreted protein VgrG